MAYKITFIGEPAKLAAGFRQRHICPAWPQGLAPGQSVMLPEIPHKSIHGLPEQFLVDGGPYTPPAPEKTKPKPAPKLEK